MKAARKRNLWLLLFAGVLLLIAGAVFFYQSRLKAPSQDEVDVAVKARDWQQVVSLLNRTDLTVDEGQNFFNLGMAHEALGDHELAVQAFREADDRNYERDLSRFHIASIYAQMGETQRATHWLKDAIDAGYDDYDAIAGDPYLSKLPLPKSDEEIESEKVFTGLDFLIGTWNTASGVNSATGSVTFAQVIPGYMVTETWTGIAPGGASGVYIFDPSTNEWSYSFVDGYGRRFEGAVRTGRQLVITGTLTYMDGVEALRRVEIRSSGGVVDYAIADSRDGGRTWDDEERRRLNVPSDAPRPNF